MLPDLRKRVSCICSAVNVTHMYVHGENEDPGDRYVEPYVLYISQMLSPKGSMDFSKM